jgi:sortase (surface protein transpeptidase)
LGIAAELDPLHLDGARELIPPEYGRAGWIPEGPEPGEPGRAVIAGHVDSRTGPDVFWDLRSARRGDEIEVEVSDGSTVRFVVQRVGQYPRVDFPTDLVYGGARDIPELRLITCGGPYERENGGYQDNVVVFAEQAESPPGDIP